MKKFCKKLLSGILAVALCVSVASGSVFAADDTKLVQITLDQNEKIVFDGADTDGMFPNFQNLYPGDQRTQTLRLINRNGMSASFYLRIEAAEQAQDLSQDELNRVYELLYGGYLKLKVVNGETLLFENLLGGKGDVSNPPVAGTATSALYGLGSLGDGNYADLTMELTVDPSLDSKYADLVAKVNWFIEARWNLPYIPPNPDGSDDTDDSEPSDETIDESSVPLTSFPTDSSVPEASWVPNPDGGEDETIDDDDTPLTPFPEQEKAPQTGVDFPVVPVCVAGVCVGTAVVLMVLTRKKKSSAK